MAISSDIKYKQDPAKLNKATLYTFFNIISEWELRNQEAMVLPGLTPHNSSKYYR